MIVLSELKPGERIKGPSGTVYDVIEVKPTHVIVYSRYTTIDGAKLLLDQVALNHFKPYTTSHPNVNLVYD